MDTHFLNRSAFSFIAGEKIEEIKWLKLCRAVEEGNYHMVNHLICSGMNVNKPPDAGFKPLLHLAAATADVQLVRLIIKHGANCHARDIQDRTPLHSAVTATDRPDIVELLIDEGAVVDARDKHQNTPFLLAVQYGFIQSVEKLIARGASVDAVEENGYSALHLASISSSVNLNIVKMLTSLGSDIEAVNVQGATPLHYAVLRNNSTDLIQLLVVNGADVNKKIRDDSTDFPLYLAVCRSDYATAHLLLKLGARVNEANNEGETALHVACENELDDVAALLVKFGANINARNSEGEVPFELLPNTLSSEATAKIIIREAVKLEALGQLVFEGYKQMVQSFWRYSRFDRECREELERMRSERINVDEDNTVSFFDIFSKNDEKLVALARNKNIVTAFEESDYLASFTIYDLAGKLEAAKKRANFLMGVEDGLLDVLGDILPTLIVYKIATYVTEKELDNDCDRVSECN